MADLSGVTTNFLATASETFEDNLSASITAGAAIVPVNNASEYVNGDIAVITVDAGTNDEAIFVGRKNGNQFEDCIWTEGNVSADHASGAPVVDYDSATHYNLVTKALKGIMEQDGKLKADPIREALNLSTASTAGWEVFPNTLQVSSGYSQGAKIYNLTVPNADASAIASQGMALRYERGTTPPANSLDLESSTSQYATKATPAGISFTDDYTLEALFTLESYTGAEQIIVGRRNGTTEGWSLSVNASGQLVASAYRIAANNRILTSNRILPLGEPIHVAVTQDHSGNVHAMYINGESVTFTNTTTGTITAIVQGTTDLRVGALSSAASLYLDGRVQEVRVWNTLRTSTQINDNMGQSLTGSETGLVAYYPFSTNLNDLTANANHLTGSGGAAVSTGNAFATREYARVISATYSSPNTTIQVYSADGFIPNMTLNSLFFSTGEAPYGLPQALQVTSYNSGKRSVTPQSLSKTFVRFAADEVSGASTNTIPILFNSVQYNIGDCYSASTGLFTAPVTGLYHFDANVNLVNLAGQGAWGSWRKNGVEIKRFNRVDNITGGPAVSAGIDIILRAGDTFAVGGVVVGTPRNLEAGWSYFNGRLLFTDI